MQYERMLNKDCLPTNDEINHYIGANSVMILTKLDQELSKYYLINKQLRFPFGKSYGWSYKYSHVNYHLFYLFFENNALNMMIQIGDGLKGDLLFKNLSDYAQDLWKNRYPCGNNGGWINYRILNENQLEEIYQIIYLKRKPKAIKAN